MDIILLTLWTTIDPLYVHLGFLEPIVSITYRDCPHKSTISSVSLFISLQRERTRVTSPIENARQLQFYMQSDNLLSNPPSPHSLLS